MNKKVVFPLRKILGQKRYLVYDKLYLKKEFIQEMEENGFKVVKMFPVLNHFWMQTLLSRPFKLLGMKYTAIKIIKLLEELESAQPYQWVALCQKK